MILGILEFTNKSANKIIRKNIKRRPLLSEDPLPLCEGQSFCRWLSGYTTIHHSHTSDIPRTQLFLEQSKKVKELFSVVINYWIYKTLRFTKLNHYQSMGWDLPSGFRILHRKLVWTSLYPLRWTPSHSLGWSNHRQSKTQNSESAK